MVRWHKVVRLIAEFANLILKVLLFVRILVLCQLTKSLVPDEHREDMLAAMPTLIIQVSQDLPLA